MPYEMELSPETFPKGYAVRVELNPHPHFSGWQLRVLFENGWGASVISNEHSYGGSQGFYELAVTAEFCVDYDNPVTGPDGPLGWLGPLDVLRLLDQIKALPARIG